MPLGKVVQSKLSEHSVDVPTANGTERVEFRRYRAAMSNAAATMLTRSSDFYRILRDEWREPLQRVLLVRGGGVGDVLLTTPLIRHLSMRGISVDYMTTVAHAPLLHRNPHVTNILTRSLTDRPHVDSELSRYLEAARDEYDAVIDLRWYPERLESSSMSGHKGMSSHRADIFYRALEITRIPQDRSLDLFLSDEEINYGRHIVGKLNHSCSYVWNTTTANRNWKITEHLAVIKGLCDTGVTPVLLCSKRVTSPDRRCLNLTGALTLRETAAIIGACDVTLTPDTGLFHVAQALQKPTLTYMGAFPVESRATSRALTVLNDVSQCDRGPCRGYSCAYQNTKRENQCLKVPAAHVVASALRMIEDLYGNSVGLAKPERYTATANVCRGREFQCDDQWIHRPGYSGARVGASAYATT
jgi:ADP-heptose:LPS heptosyltransferase